MTVKVFNKKLRERVEKAWKRDFKDKFSQRELNFMYKEYEITENEVKNHPIIYFNLTEVKAGSLSHLQMQVASMLDMMEGVDDDEI
ncbi:MAG: hypothetical protein LBV53_02935 [Mycoplasmataceae bacterium]|nr:hypothetical protein [Mycoplasmataceae bacterium]